jgi:hypothetical protein
MIRKYLYSRRRSIRHTQDRTYRHLAPQYQLLSLELMAPSCLPCAHALHTRVNTVSRTQSHVPNHPWTDCLYSWTLRVKLAMHYNIAVDAMDVDELIGMHSFASKLRGLSDDTKSWRHLV